MILTFRISFPVFRNGNALRSDLRLGLFWIPGVMMFWVGTAFSSLCEYLLGAGYLFRRWIW